MSVNIAQLTPILINKQVINRIITLFVFDDEEIFFVDFFIKIFTQTNNFID